MTILDWGMGRKALSASSQRVSRQNRARYRLAEQAIEQCEDRVLLASVTLGAASTFAVLGGSTVTNTGATTIIGNVGVSPGTSITGFPPGVVTSGSIHAGDTLASHAQTDLATAYGVIQGETPTTVLTGVNLGGLTLTPGVYFYATSAQLTGALTLDAQGNPNARFDFQIGSTLTTAASSSITLINGAQASNVYFQVGSSATIGTGTVFEGNILADTSITVTTGASFLDGRALALNGAVTLDTNNFSIPRNSPGLDPGLTNPTAVPVQAVEGQSTGMVTLATFVDTSPSSTVQDWNAQVNWGDGSPVSTAMVQLGGGDPASGGNVFFVIASHTYAEEGPPSTPPTVTFTDVGNPANLPVVLPLAITVLDAALTSSNGTTINGPEGASSTIPQLLGTFVDANPLATPGDFTATVPIGGWGDGLPIAPVTLTITQVGATASNTVFELLGSHTYAEEGQFPITINVSDVGGAATVVSSTALITDAPLAAPVQTPFNTTEATVFPTPQFAPPLFDSVASGQPVATFTDANSLAPISDFTATIDWGDGTPPSTATISQPGGAGTVFDVLGAHTYADSGVNGGVGHYVVTVNITDVGGSKLTVTNTANVADNPIAVAGILNPASDSGKNNLDAITNVTQPNFYGTVLVAGTSTPEPYAHVTLFANGVAIGNVQAGSDGAWSMTSNMLAQGAYTITASATDQFGQTVSPLSTIVSNLVVDATPPVITALTFDRFDATLTVTYQDNLSGMDLASLTNSAFYHITAKPLVSYVHVPKMILPTSISYTPGALPSDPVVVNVVFNNGRTFRGGRYLVVIDSGVGNHGIQDVAGNAMSGNFYGTFPSGDGLVGGDFVAAIYTFHNVVLPFVPVADGYVPPAAGIDPPAGSVHVGKTHKLKITHRPKAAETIVRHPVRSALVHDSGIYAIDARHKSRR